MPSGQAVVLYPPPRTAGAGIDRGQESGWPRLWGVAEAVLAVCVLAGAAKEIRGGLTGRKAERAGGTAG
ncbi:hypothetical protein OG524_21880 [Streptomyces sp. NBC_01520]|uniref:hypothetical protein n=1 Tax=Streptomyces sp. NBC_01520 TaxID=2903892 RepID=UPI00386765A5